MHVSVEYKWEDGDPDISFVDHAISRLAGFQEKSWNDNKDMPHERKAYNRVMKGNTFFHRDVRTLASYMRHLASQARARYATLSGEVAAGVRQAADNCEERAAELEQLFSQLLTRSL